MSVEVGIVWFICTIVLVIVYHNIFAVYYLGSVADGITKELVSSAIISVFLTALILHLWYVAAAIFIIAGIVFSKKTESKVPIIVAIILSIGIAIAGSNFKSNKLKEDMEFHLHYIQTSELYGSNMYRESYDWCLEHQKSMTKEQKEIFSSLPKPETEE